MIRNESVCLHSAIWDLHIHSNCCTKADKELAKLSVVEYVDKLLEVLRQCELLEMISFTDHNRISIDVYKEFMRRDSGIALLPGVEIDVLLEDGGTDKHLVVYFDCMGDERRLETLANNVNKIMVDNSVSDSNPISIATLLDKLLETGIRFAISPHAFKQEKRGIDYDMHSLDPENRHIDKYIDQFFCFWETSGISQSAYAIQFLKEMDRGDRESIVSFSDSKDFAKLKKYLAAPHQFFDALPTFDGVQMVGTEVSRISVAPTDVPEGNLGKYIGSIDSGSAHIRLSPRLNVIIGGRGSGKSALIDRLAISIMGKDIESSFSPERLRFLEGTRCSVASLAGSDISDGSFNVEFFDQGYISNLFAKTGKSFNDELQKYFSSAFSQIDEIETQTIRAKNIQCFNELFEEASSPKPENMADFAGKYQIDRDEELGIGVKKGDKQRVDPSLQDFSYSDTLDKIERAIVKALPKFLKTDPDVAKSIESFKDEIAEIAHKRRVEYFEGDYVVNLFIDKYFAKKDAISEAHKQKSDATRLFKETFAAEVEEIVNRVAIVRAYFAIQNDFESHYENPLFVDGEKPGAKAFLFKKVLDIQEPIDYLAACLDNAIPNPGHGESCTRANLKTYVEKFCFDDGCYKSGKSAAELMESLKSFDLDYIESLSIEYRNDDGTYESIMLKSPGTRTNILLEYIVHRNTNIPLLIDQPEDNVDNQTIYRDIVRWFTKLKRKRQVIVVTHDANIVINADAENLVIAKQLKSGDFSYQQGALESSGILVAASNILDGGAEAVRRRLMKYGG